MKIKAPQILGGIAALAYIFSNLFVVNYIIPVFAFDIWSSRFWIWPIFFVIEVTAISIFVFMFKNMSLRYIAVGAYLLTRLISSLYWMITSYEPTIGYFAGLFVGWPFWGGLGPTFIASLFGLLSFILLVIAFILSFRYRSQTATPTPGYSGNRTVPTITHTPPVQVKKAQGAYGDIEILGDLLKKGLLTQEEFDLKKREILGLDK